MVSVILKPNPDNPGDYLPDQPVYLIANASWRLTIHSHVWRPPTDVYETDETVVVRVEIAGMEKESFAINIDQNTLSIHGTRPDTPEHRAYYQMEIRHGEFYTDVDLPVPIDLEKVTAEYHDGLLKVILPKTSPKHIKIAKD
jgi:HSP20 family protein